MQSGESAIDVAQVLLTAYDVGLSKNWRAEDRHWRKEDMDWREREQDYLNKDYAFMQQERIWRQADVEQTHLDNARYLWQKFVEKNKREVEEKTGQLKAVSGIAALLAGFAMVAFLEMQFTFERPQQVPQYHAIMPLHGLTTGTTVAVEMTCVVMCTLLLSSVLRVGHSFVGEAEEAEFMLHCRQFVSTHQPSSRPPAPARSFAAHWAVSMEAQWRRAVRLFSMGLPLFCLQLALAAWVKFWQAPLAAVLVSSVMGAAVALLVLLQCVWGRHLLQHDAGHQGADRYDQAPMGLPFDWHLKPLPPEPWRPSAPPPQHSGCNAELDHMVPAQPPQAHARSSCQQGTSLTGGAEASHSGRLAGGAMADWRGQQHWHRQDTPVPAGSILQWTLPGQLLLWALDGLQQLAAWAADQWQPGATQQPAQEVDGARPAAGGAVTTAVAAMEQAGASHAGGSGSAVGSVAAL